MSRAERQIMSSAGLMVDGGCRSVGPSPLCYQPLAASFSFRPVTLNRHCIKCSSRAHTLHSYIPCTVSFRCPVEVQD
jgi:hypothetical protein